MAYQYPVMDVRYPMMPSHAIKRLYDMVKHGPKTAVPRTAADVTDMFFGPLKGAWKLVRGVYRFIKGRRAPFHKRRIPFSFNARAYKKNVGALARAKAKHHN